MTPFPAMKKEDAEVALLPSAELTSSIIRAVDTDNRGTLIRLIAEDLSKHAQGFTSVIFKSAAARYGE